MNDFIEALKEVKRYGKDFKITLSKKEVLEITNEIDRLHSIIKEVRELVEQKIKGYMEVIDMLKTSSVETKKKEIIELKYRIREQEELLEILDKENI